jgi:hypothetical protein
MMRGVGVCVLAGSLGVVSAAAAADPATMMKDHPLTNLIVGLTHDVLSGTARMGSTADAEVPVRSALSLPGTSLSAAASLCLSVCSQSVLCRACVAAARELLMWRREQTLNCLPVPVHRLWNRARGGGCSHLSQARRPCKR